MLVQISDSTCSKALACLRSASVGAKRTSPRCPAPRYACVFEQALSKIRSQPNSQLLIIRCTGPGISCGTTEEDIKHGGRDEKGTGQDI